MRSPRVDPCDLDARATLHVRGAPTYAAVLGLLLLLLAACSTTLLCTWHCATFHDDGAVASFARVATPHAGDAGAVGTPLHAAAHTACHGYTGPTPVTATAVAVLAAAGWPEAALTFVDGVTPAAVLRPPRR